jgi:hypothetical protein
MITVLPLFSNGASVTFTSEVYASAILLLLIVDCYSCTSLWVAYIDLTFITFMSDFIRIHPAVLDLKHVYTLTQSHSSVPMGIVEINT